MEISVKAFGQIADIFGSRSLQLKNVDSTDDLRNKIENEFPELKKLNYLVAVDRNIIQNDTIISDKTEIALLPPFSGG
ncbi:MAG: MoaD/ThiS family protein [Flavisolibacter sp.]